MATQVTCDVKTNADEGSFTVVTTEGLSEITNTKVQKKTVLRTSGDSEIGGKAFKNNSRIVVKKAGDDCETKAGDDCETTEVTLNTTLFKNSIFNAKGETKLTIDGTNFNKSIANMSNYDDSIQFKGGKVAGSALKMGKGDDTVTFGANTQFANTTKIGLGKDGGSDVVEFKSAPTDGKVVINQFDKNDTLIVGGESFSLDDINNGKAAEFTNIKINFA